MTYEIRDFPDDLPFVFDTKKEAIKAGIKRVKRIGGEVLLYEMSMFNERFVGVIE